MVAENRKMNADDFKRDHRLESVIEGSGIRLVGGGDRKVTNVCPSHQHAKGHLCVTVDVGKQLWNCNDCKVGGDVIRWLALATGKTDAEVLRNGNGAAPLPPATSTAKPEELQYKTVATYDYLDGNGTLVYQVVRQQAECKSKPSGYVKRFRQRQPDKTGGWVYNMDGIERVLYRLPEVLKSKTVWIVEGEKDADNLVRLGFSATCNVGGAGKWMDGYTDSLHKRNVVICGDNDDAGRDHAKLVFDSIIGRAKSVRTVKLPQSCKDVTDYIATFKTDDEAKLAIHALFDSAVPFVKGVSLPIFLISELQGIYHRHVNSMAENSLNLGKWLPSLNKIRPLVPGEFALILGGTGIGKTAALSNIALSANPLPTLFFELELPPELMFERLLALHSKISCSDIELSFKSGELLPEEPIDKKLGYLHICTQSRLTVEDIETIITRSELKIGTRPKVVLLDYIGLVKGFGKSRYERVSNVAEELKVIAKTTRTILIAASQVGRDATADGPEITLNSGKDSGSLENSSGLVLGLWRDEDDGALMHLQVLKSTKGGAGLKIPCNYNLNTLAITERSKFDPEDLPQESKSQTRFESAARVQDEDLPSRNPYTD